MGFPAIVIRISLFPYCPNNAIFWALLIWADQHTSPRNRRHGVKTHYGGPWRRCCMNHVCLSCCSLETKFLSKSSGWDPLHPMLPTNRSSYCDNALWKNIHWIMKWLGGEQETVHTSCLHWLSLMSLGANVIIYLKNSSLVHIRAR